jgi:hypothetical protein
MHPSSQSPTQNKTFFFLTDAARNKARAEQGLYFYFISQEHSIREKVAQNCKASTVTSEMSEVRYTRRSGS